MTNATPVSDAILTQTLAALRRSNGSKRATAQMLGIERSTLRNRLKLAEARGIDPAAPSAGPAEGGAQRSASLPQTLAPICASASTSALDDGALWDRVEGNFKRNRATHAGLNWHRVRVNSDAPMGICWFGDPHLDDNGCNIPLLRRDVALVAGTPGMVGANLGDQTNNWVGRLIRLYEDQTTTRKQARQLISSFLMRSGIEWLCILIGNHDEWRGGGEILAEITQNVIPLHDWQARIRLIFPNRRTLPIWAAHDFPGSSQWNPLHGPLKKAMLSGAAKLYVCGHKHNWSCFAGEDAQRGGVFWLARARGYKEMDAYAENAGFGQQKHGASIVSIVDPQARTETGFLRCFEDVADACEYLTWLRERAGIKDRN